MASKSKSAGDFSARERNLVVANEPIVCDIRDRNHSGRGTAGELAYNRWAALRIVIRYPLHGLAQVHDARSD
jgi:hypothetical protein